jgi:hypothetical protein
MKVVKDSRPVIRASVSNMRLKDERITEKTLYAGWNKKSTKQSREINKSGSPQKALLKKLAFVIVQRLSTCKQSPLKTFPYIYTGLIQVRML